MSREESNGKDLTLLCCSGLISAHLHAVRWTLAPLYWVNGRSDFHYTHRQRYANTSTLLPWGHWGVKEGDRNPLRVPGVASRLIIPPVTILQVQLIASYWRMCHNSWQCRFFWKLCNSQCLAYALCQFYSYDTDKPAPSLLQNMCGWNWVQ